MRTFSSIAVSLFLSSTAIAEPAINLSPMKGDKTVDIVETKNVTGTCGTSIVRILGVTDVVGNFYNVDLDAGRVIVRAGPNKELILSSDNGVLSDHNGVACVTTKSGSRLLVWSNCAGSACGDKFSFFVIDPVRLVFLAPKDPRNELCDTKCASLSLGDSLPKKINDQ